MNAETRISISPMAYGLVKTQPNGESCWYGNDGTNAEGIAIGSSVRCDDGDVVGQMTLVSYFQWLGGGLGLDLVLEAGCA